MFNLSKLVNTIETDRRSKIVQRKNGAKNLVLKLSKLQNQKQKMFQHKLRKNNLLLIWNV